MVDLRRGDAQQRAVSRGAIHGALVADARVLPVADDGLRAALAGEAQDAAADDAKAALTEAKSAYGSLQCPGAVTAARRAVDAYAAMQARGDDVTDALVQAYSYVLLCSGGAADVDQAHWAAQRLRGLGADPPPGVDDETWAKYPAIDATANVYIAEVRIVAPEGAVVWIDHARAGKAPLATHLAEGTHIVAVGHRTGTGVVHATIEGRDPQTVEVAINAATADRWGAIRDWVGGWRAGTRAPTPYDLGQLMLSANVRVLFVATQVKDTGEERLEAWGLPRDQKEAVLIGSGSPENIDDVIELTVDTVTAWDAGVAPGGGGGPIPAPANKKKQDKAKPWWVYAAIVGAVVVGGGIVLASDLADDKQVIRLDYP